MGVVRAKVVRMFEIEELSQSDATGNVTRIQHLWLVAAFVHVCGDDGIVNRKVASNNSGCRGFELGSLLV